MTGERCVIDLENLRIDRKVNDRISWSGEVETAEMRGEGAKTPTKRANCFVSILIPEVVQFMLILVGKYGNRAGKQAASL